MKISILKNELNESIGHVSKAISSRTTIPILTGIKLEVNHQGVTSDRKRYGYLHPILHSCRE
jgi:DNA polymerase-3 subunit beta